MKRLKEWEAAKRTRSHRTAEAPRVVIDAAGPHNIPRPRARHRQSTSYTAFLHATRWEARAYIQRKARQSDWGIARLLAE